MPVVAAQIPNLQLIGPVLDVQIGPTPFAAQAMQNEGGTVPDPITVAALIDTGASSSVIQCGLAQRLALHPVATQKLSTPSSENVLCDQYMLRLTFYPTGGILMPVYFDAVFTEAPLKGQNIQCLLGRDFLAHAVLTYTGPTNSFVLCM